MDRLTYARGEGWLVVVAGHALAWLDIDDEDARVAEVLAALRTGAGVASVLDVLGRDGLPATPAFVIAQWDVQSLALLVRGAASVTVSSQSGDETVSASRISTWAERVFDAPTALTLNLDAGTGSVAALDLAEGVARAVLISVGAVAKLGAANSIDVPRPTGVSKAKGRGRALAQLDDKAVPSAVAALKTAEASVPLAPVSAPEAQDVGETIADVDLIEDQPDPQPEVLPRDEPELTFHDELFGATVVRSVEDAAVRAPAEQPTQSTQKATEHDADHDGETIFGEQLASLLKGASAERETPLARDEPPPFVLRSSSGETISLARPVIIGRLPSVGTPVASGELPELISVAGTNPDVSRNHVRVTVEGGTVVVTDLHSRNGTTCTLPGKQPSRLRAGDPTPIIVGTVIDLGGGATYAVDRP